MKTLIKSLLLFAVIGNVHAAETSVSVNYLTGDVDGYVQTPTGGGIGTSTRNRPTFKELGFDDINTYDIEVRGNLWGGQFTGGYQRIRFDGKSQVQQDFMSQGDSFTIGDNLDVQIKTDWYRFNYLREFGDDNLRWKPGVGIVIFDFDYQLATPAGNDNGVDRTYAKVGVRVGGEVDVKFNDLLTLQLSSFAGLPIDNTPRIFDIAASANFAIGKRVELFGKYGYQKIDYEDQQEMPNHIRVVTKPVSFGLRFNFQ